jgi:hypothetical protein
LDACASSAQHNLVAAHTQRGVLPAAAMSGARCALLLVLALTTAASADCIAAAQERQARLRVHQLLPPPPRWLG